MRLLLAALLLSGCASAPLYVGASATAMDDLGDDDSAGALASVERRSDRWHLEAVASAVEGDHGPVDGWQWAATGRGLVRVAGSLWLGAGVTTGEQITDEWRDGYTAPQVMAIYRDLWLVYSLPDDTHHETESLVLSWREDVGRWRFAPRAGWVRYDGDQLGALLGFSVGFKVSP